jgi:hypothetical protein
VTSAISQGTANTATITGDMSGSATNPIFNRENNFLFVSPETTSNAVISNQFDAGYVMGPVSWLGPATTTGTVHGLQIVRGAGTPPLPSSYAGYGSTSGVVLANGNVATGKNIVTTAVNSQNFSGSVTVPAVSNLMLGSKSFALQLGAGSIPLGTDMGTSTTFSYTTPVVPSSSITFSASAAGMNRASQATSYGNAANASTVSVSLPSPPQLSLPAAGATGIALATQGFSWAPMSPTGIYVTVMTTQAPTRSFLIYTASTNFVLPSTVELGLGQITTGTTFGWRVFGLGTSASATPTVDDVLAPKMMLTAPPTTGTTWEGLSESRTFTN